MKADTWPRELMMSCLLNRGLVVLVMVIACTALAVLAVAGVWLAARNRQLAGELALLNERLRRQEVELEKLRGNRKQEAVERLATGLQHEVPGARGLPLKAELKIRVIEREEVTRLVRRKLAEQYQGKKLAAYGKVLVSLGLLGSDDNLEELLVNLYGSQVAALYDEDAKELLIVDDSPLEGIAGRMVVFHEITHALQDQHFSLKKLPLASQSNDDLSLAVASLVEGDATMVMAGSLGEAGKEQAAQDVVASLTAGGPDISEVPGFIVEELLFPYVGGMSFVGAIYSRGGWEAVNRVYGDLPQSTEQILHPSKYYDEPRDEPQEVELGLDEEDVGSDWECIVRNRMGEYRTLSMMSRFIPHDEARRAAEGWDGDGYGAFERNGKLLFVWRSIWDSEKDAREFCDAYGRFVESRNEKSALRRKSEGCWEFEDRVVVAVANANEVLAVEAPDFRMAETVLGKLPQFGGRFEKGTGGTANGMSRVRIH